MSAKGSVIGFVLTASNIACADVAHLSVHINKATIRLFAITAFMDSNANKCRAQTIKDIKDEGFTQTSVRTNKGAAGEAFR